MSAMCKICEKEFSSQFNLNKHLKNVHKTKPVAVSYKKSVWSYKCEEPSCNSSFHRNQGLIDYLLMCHSIEVESETRQFKTLQDFQEWKGDIEKATICNYVPLRGKKMSASSGRQSCYYNCNRTGKLPYSEKGENKVANKKLPKSQGSCKLNKSCVSYIKLVKENGKEIVAVWQKTHYGHENEIQHIRLSRADREKFVTTLEIIGSFKIDMQEGVRNKDDATRVHLCIEELQRSEFNSVLLYKREGDILESFPLEENDFCLIIMSQYQQHMLVKYGNNIIVVDGTHGLNNYDFELTTLMVVDNFNEGFPGAFMFTNRKDTLIHQIFFEVIESKVGNKISPNTIMSDITGVFYQAWSSVMGVVPFQLYCTWHIDRAWRNNLNKIPNIEKRKEVYKTLKMQIQKNLEVILKKYYYENCKLWAYCYRKHCGINTNMYLESMHKQIKYFYLHGTTVKRLDKGLHAVLQYSRDKMVEHLIKGTKGKSSIHKRNILQRHTTAISSQFSAESIENSEDEYQLEEIIQEVQQREQRKCNIIVYVVKEQQAINGAERLEQDKQHVQSIFNALQTNNVEMTKLTRLGAFDASKRSRPLRVTLKDGDSVHRVVKQARNLKEKEQYCNINISLDRSPKQITLFKKVKAEYARRTDE
ncbi:hypothetical protein NQ314_020049, partial [Rhamnusium bicolor]